MDAREDRRPRPVAPRGRVLRTVLGAALLLVAGVTSAPAAAAAGPDMPPGPGSVTGVLQYESGEPLPGKAVGLVWECEPLDACGAVTVTTDSTGRFTVPDLPLGRYTLSSVFGFWDDVSRDVFDARRLELTPDAPVLDLGAWSVPFIGEMSGTVRDPLGGPVPDVPMWTSCGLIHGSTDETGAFWLPGGLPEQGVADCELYLSTAPMTTTWPFTLEDDGLIVVDPTLDAVRLAGTLYASDGGRYTAGDAYVDVLAADGQRLFDLAIGPDGSWRSPLVVPGTYRLAFFRSSPGLQREELTVYGGGTSVATASDVVVAAGGPYRTIDALDARVGAAVGEPAVVPAPPPTPTPVPDASPTTPPAAPVAPAPAAVSAPTRPSSAAVVVARPARTELADSGTTAGGGVLLALALLAFGVVLRRVARRGDWSSS
ncbi:carboxypeptidase regulatory-like domain-containing protein [Cellulomonas marina]|uniref:Carboxypeptidase regulatory-like domain-containing protein n=1 Tax=Cellulomonas marina TaxID=988821 RepID=A0A1I0X9P7_9CELL|nr:carboxypeptidase regulatory-like domain-containing protein [Cellulomonas marina]SFA97397.1 hypothetical protein SAMN05421867_104212 [Cellulomonas marina]